ncbi:MAG: hypothetical protein RLZZ511_3225 [Cyanobacteriota bacterium]
MIRDRAFGHGDFVLNWGIEQSGLPLHRLHQTDGTTPVEIQRLGHPEPLQQRHRLGDRHAFAIPGLFTVDHDEPQGFAAVIGGDDRPGVGFIFWRRIGEGLTILQNQLIAGEAIDGTAGTIGLGQDLGLVLRIEADNGPSRNSAAGIDLPPAGGVTNSIGPIAATGIVIPRCRFTERVEEAGIHGQVLVVALEKFAGGEGIQLIAVSTGRSGRDEELELGVGEVDFDNMDNIGARCRQNAPLIDCPRCKIHAEGNRCRTLKIAPTVQRDRQPQQQPNQTLNPPTAPALHGTNARDRG